MTEIFVNSLEKVVTAAQMKEIERKADEAGLSYYQMMENAGTCAFSKVRELYPSRANILVFIGKGNNGGDGSVAARLAINMKLNVAVIKVEGEPVTRDAMTNYELLKQMDCRILDLSQAEEDAILNSPSPEETALLNSSSPEEVALQNLLGLKEGKLADTVVIDALYGTGFKGSLRENGIKACSLMNLLKKKGAALVAFDIPSGVNGDTGEICQGAVTADHTMAFHLKKPAHVMEDSKEVMGNVWVCDIGIQEKP